APSVTAPRAGSATPTTAFTDTRAYTWSTVGGDREPGREPVADDHRPRRTCDVVVARQGGRGCPATAGRGLSAPEAGPSARPGGAAGCVRRAAPRDVTAADGGRPEGGRRERGDRRGFRYGLRDCPPLRPRPGRGVVPVGEIGRASCRERGSVRVGGGAV